MSSETAAAWALGVSIASLAVSAGMLSFNLMRADRQDHLEFIKEYGAIKRTALVAIDDWTSGNPTLEKRVKFSESMITISMMIKDLHYTKNMRCAINSHRHNTKELYRVLVATMRVLERRDQTDFDVYNISEMLKETIVGLKIKRSFFPCWRALTYKPTNTSLRCPLEELERLLKGIYLQDVENNAIKMTKL